MKNMKMTASEKKDTVELGPSTISSKGPDYPWGLNINLDSGSMDKLDIDDLPEVGEKMVLNAIVEVVSVSANANKERESRNISLQITDMDLSPAKKKRAADEVMYGGKDK